MRALSISTGGELGTPLSIGSRGELVLSRVIKMLNPTGGGADGPGKMEREDKLIVAVIKEFMKRA